MLYLAVNDKERPGALLWFLYTMHSPELRGGFPSNRGYLMDPKVEAQVIYHLRRAVAELGLAHALTESHQVQRTGEVVLSELEDLLYLLEQGPEERG